MVARVAADGVEIAEQEGDLVRGVVGIGLAQRVDRALAMAAVLLVALLFLPTALLVERYPTPAPWVSCGSDCPRNAFMVVAHEPRVIEQLVTPAQVLAAIGLVVAIIARLVDRVRGASKLGRRTLTPVLAVAMGWAVVLGLTLGVRPEALRLANGVDDYGFDTAVDVVEPLGNEILLNFRAGGAPMVARVDPGVRVKAHDSVRFTVDPDRLHFFDSSSEAAL